MSRHAASSTLTHYFRTLFRAAGLKWDSDNAAEISVLIDDIIDAAVAEAVANVKSKAKAQADEEAPTPSSQIEDIVHGCKHAAGPSGTTLRLAVAKALELGCPKDRLVSYLWNSQYSTQDVLSLLRQEALALTVGWKRDPHPTLERDAFERAELLLFETRPDIPFSYSFDVKVEVKNALLAGASEAEVLSVLSSKKIKDKGVEEALRKLNEKVKARLLSPAPSPLTAG